jgi:hypothetical protein
MQQASPIAAMVGRGQNIVRSNSALLKGVSRDGVCMEWLFLVGIGKETAFATPQARSEQRGAVYILVSETGRKTDVRAVS